MIALIGLACIGLAALAIHALGWAIGCAGIAGWLLGVAFTSALLSEMGWHDEWTIGDSYTGDDGLDTLLIAAWPLFWPCWAATQAGRAIGSLVAPRP